MHRLPSIIEDFEKKLKGMTEAPTPNDYRIKRQIALIADLRDIYDKHSHPLWDYCVEIQKAYDSLIEKDKEIDGLVIKINLTKDSHKHGYITLAV